MKRYNKMWIGGLMLGALALAGTGCSTQNAGDQTKTVAVGETHTEEQTTEKETAKEDVQPFYAGMSKAHTPDESELLTGSMNLADYADRWVYYDEYDCYGLEYVVYCEQPSDGAKQCMNIYVPAAYMNEDGTVNETGTVNGYSAATAPIIYKNGVGGYAQADASRLSEKDSGYLEQGYVYVSPASRGKETQAEDGAYIGKSPAGLVDLKAGVRFLKANDQVMAGDSGKIISVGTSAGGAMSALLGSTGNSSDYDPYLEEMGALMDQTDDVYAAQVYCPITDLDHADMAYEWMYAEMTAYENSRSGQSGTFTEFEKAVSELMAGEYVDYINGLGLTDPDTKAALTLGEDGRSGSFYDYITEKVEAAATKHLNLLENGGGNVSYSVDDYMMGSYTAESRRPGEEAATGADLSSFLTWDGSRAEITSFDDYLASYNPRMKTCMAFDNLNMDENSAENLEFGDSDTQYMHFDTYMENVLNTLKAEYPEEYEQYYEAYAKAVGDEALAERKKLLNPLNYIGSGADTASHVRIRVGTRDADTSFSISAVLALALDNKTNADVDYALVWDQGHGDADYDGELVQWIETICK